jgi:predicted nuclease of predicted toxin-antitoxin system
VNFPQKPPEPPTYFLDRSLGRFKLATALRHAGLHIQVQDDLFAQDAPDEEWLSAVGRSGWVVLTKDDKIRYRIRERETLIAHGVRAFVLTARNITAKEMADIFLNARGKIERFLTENNGPFMVTIARSGTLRTVWPKPDPRKEGK